MTTTEEKKCCEKCTGRLKIHTCFSDTLQPCHLQTSTEGENKLICECNPSLPTQNESPYEKVRELGDRTARGVDSTKDKIVMSMISHEKETPTPTESWEEKFDALFLPNLVYGKGAMYLVKDFIHQTLQTQRQTILNEIERTKKRWHIRWEGINYEENKKFNDEVTLLINSVLDDLLRKFTNNQ